MAAVRAPEIKIAIMNDSTVLTDDQVYGKVPALQAQISDDFAPAWGIDAVLRPVPRGEEPHRDEWWLAILDDSDRAEALGYHELTNAGLPICKVFARSDQARGFQWTVTASHELLEMLADPNTHLGALVQANAFDRFLYAYEVCDPCEAEAFAYTMPQAGGTLVSDFVFPAWFDPLREIGSTRFDQGRHIQAPLQLLPGSHMDVLDITCNVWRHFRGEGQAHRYEPRPLFGTRRERRRKPLDRWRKSTVVGARRPGERAEALELTSEVLDRLASNIRELREAIDRLES